jgi:HAD superfamily hydrolase (TIGR01549 family)
MPSSTIDTVLFDIDDTLCTYRRSAAELLGVAFERVGVSPFFAAEDYFARYAEFVPRTDTVEELREKAFGAIAADAGHETDLGRAVARAYAAERDHRDVLALPGALEAVDALSEYRIGVVTNGAPSMQAQKLDGLGLTDAFEVVVHGGYDAPAKPAPEPFHRALSALDSTTERTLHVGNSLRADVAGAQAAGVGAVHVPAHPEGEPHVPEYTLESLHELPDILH